MPEVSYIIFKFWISYFGGTSFTTVSKFNMLIYLHEYFQKFQFWARMESNWLGQQPTYTESSLSVPQVPRIQRPKQFASSLTMISWELRKDTRAPHMFFPCPLRIHNALSKVKLISIMSPVDE